MKTEVLEKVELEDIGKVMYSFHFFSNCTLDIYYIGLPHLDFKDYKRLTQEIFEGTLLKKIEAKEPVVDDNTNNQRSYSGNSANQQRTFFQKMKGVKITN